LTVINVTTIFTSRLTLRDIHLTDWPAFYRMLVEPDVVRFLEYGPFDEFQTREWLSHVIVTKYDTPRLVHHLAIELPTSLNEGEVGCVIGWIALTTLVPSTREWALSFALDINHWGQGYMTEAVTALVDHAFVDLSAHRIYAEVEPDNVASTRVLEKCGFELEGRLRRKQRIRGEWRDVLHYAVLEH
jgi:ribosomal-protein-alanine N-acetyltransferase